MRNKKDALTGAIIQYSLKDKGLYLNLLSFNHGYIIAQKVTDDSKTLYLINPENKIIRYQGYRSESYSSFMKRSRDEGYFNFTDEPDKFTNIALEALKTKDISRISELEGFKDVSIKEFDYTDPDSFKVKEAHYYADDDPYFLKDSIYLNHETDRYLFSFDLPMFYLDMVKYSLFYADNYPSYKRPFIPEGLMEYVGEMMSLFPDLSSISEYEPLKFDRKIAFDIASELIDKAIEFEKEPKPDPLSIPEDKEFLSEPKISLIHEALNGLEKVEAKKDKKNQIESESTTPVVFQAFPIIPKWIVTADSNPYNVLLDFQSKDYQTGVSAPGYDSASKTYKQNINQKNKRKRSVTNQLTLHKKSELTDLIDYNKIEEFTDIKLDKTKIIGDRKTKITKEDIEVYNGIATCINYYIATAKKHFIFEFVKELLPIPLSVDDIARGMGYKGKASERVKTQIWIALSKFDNLRVTHDWSNELSARQLDLEKAINMYGEEVTYKPIAVQLLNFDIVSIEKSKTQKTKTINGKTVEYQGKPGIIINKFPPLIAYNLICNHQVLLPAEWIDIPNTGKSDEMKRIKRYIAKRTKDLQYFRERELNRSRRSKKNYDPNRDNFNKFVIDDLIERGGYDMETHETVEVKDENGCLIIDESGNPIMREATPEELKKQEHSIKSKRSRVANNIIDYLQKLQDRVPEIKDVKIEYDAKGKAESVRVIMDLVK